MAENTESATQFSKEQGKNPMQTLTVGAQKNGWCTEERLVHRRTAGAQKNGWCTEERLVHRRTVGAQKNGWCTEELSCAGDQS